MKRSPWGSFAGPPSGPKAGPLVPPAPAGLEYEGRTGERPQGHEDAECVGLDQDLHHVPVFNPQMSAPSAVRRRSLRDRKVVRMQQMTNGPLVLFERAIH